MNAKLWGGGDRTLPGQHMFPSDRILLISPLVPEVGQAPKPSAVNSVDRFNDSTSVSHAHIETL